MKEFGMLLIQTSFSFCTNKVIEVRETFIATSNFLWTSIGVNRQALLKFRIVPARPNEKISCHVVKSSRKEI